MSEFQCANNVVTPLAPPSGNTSLYTKSDGLWYFQTSAGVELPLKEIGPQGIAGGTVHDPSGYVQAKPTASEVVLHYLASRTVAFPVALAASVAKSIVAATATAVFMVQKNSVEIGTITFAAASTVGVFAAASSTNLVASDLLEVVAPATPDATLSGVSITLAGQGSIGALDLSGGVTGRALASAVVLSHIAVHTETFQIDFANSHSIAKVAAVASTEFTILKNGSPVGTLTFGASGTVGTFVADLPTVLVNGDLLTIVAPVTPDATLADIDITLAGTL